MQLPRHRQLVAHTAVAVCQHSIHVRRRHCHDFKSEKFFLIVFVSNCGVCLVAWGPCGVLCRQRLCPPRHAPVCKRQGTQSTPDIKVRGTSSFHSIMATSASTNLFLQFVFDLAGKHSLAHAVRFALLHFRPVA